MTHSAAITAAFAIGLGLTASSCGAQDFATEESALDQRPNIILVLVDDMRTTSRRWQRGHGGPPPIGVYLGSPTIAEAARLASAIDFAFLDYSVRTPVGAWARGRDRFAWFAQAGVQTWPIFYATGEVDMRAALVAGGPQRAEGQFAADLAADAEYSGLEIAGFVYFTFEAMP